MQPCSLVKLLTHSLECQVHSELELPKLAALLFIQHFSKFEGIELFYVIRHRYSYLKHLKTTIPFSALPMGAVQRDQSIWFQPTPNRHLLPFTLFDVIYVLCINRILSLRQCHSQVTDDAKSQCYVSENQTVQITEATQS